MHDLQQPDILKRPGGERIAFEHPALPVLAERTVAAARAGRAGRAVCPAGTGTRRTERRPRLGNKKKKQR